MASRLQLLWCLRSGLRRYNRSDEARGANGISGLDAMLRYPIPVQNPPLPWLVRLNRQGFAGWRRAGGKLSPKLTVPVSPAGPARHAGHPIKE